MTPVSKKKLSKETEKALLDALFSSLQNLNKKSISKSLLTLLTETEIKMLIKRVAIIMLLEQNVGIDAIAKTTNTTRQTVSRISLQLQLIPREAKDTLSKRLSRWYKFNIAKDLLKQLSKIESPSKSIRNDARKITGL